MHTHSQEASTDAEDTLFFYDLLFSLQRTLGNLFCELEKVGKSNFYLSVCLSIFEPDAELVLISSLVIWTKHL